VVLDVDGVMVDYYAAIREVGSAVLGRVLVETSLAPSALHRFGLSEKEYGLVRERLYTHPRGWRNMTPLPGAVEAVRHLRSAGFDVVFLTACPMKARALREENLIGLGLSDCTVLCVEESDPDNKGAVLEALRPLAFVDDHLRMLHQAPFVPRRVWVDGGCEVEWDAKGIPFDTAPFEITPDLATWVEGFLKNLSPEESPLTDPVSDMLCSPALSQKRPAHGL
jgi:hypothetical protein